MISCAATAQPTTNVMELPSEGKLKRITIITEDVALTPPIPSFWTNGTFTTNIFLETMVTNRLWSYPAKFEPRNSETITNIAVDSDYKGTIQVGSNFYRLVDVTNFYTVKELRK